MKNISLFRHAAQLTRRAQGHRVPAGGVPTVFTFEATNLSVQLTSSGETSPFHDLPDGAVAYVEIGVDVESPFTCSEVKQAVGEFVRHGRRPKFGPPIVDYTTTPDPAVDEQGAILTWIRDVLAGEPVSDFAESFPLVRAVRELKLERDALRLDRGADS